MNSANSPRGFNVIPYSKQGFVSKSWQLPSDWGRIMGIDLD